MERKSRRRRFNTLQAWREAHELSQRAAARRFGLSQAGWSKIEIGQRCPRPELAKRLVEGTGVPLEVLMGIAS